MKQQGLVGMIISDIKDLKWFLFAFFLFLTTSILKIDQSYKTRTKTVEYTELLIKEESLETERRHLLLERSIQKDPIRVQKIAQEKLGMILPSSQKIKTIRE